MSKNELIEKMAEAAKAIEEWPESMKKMRELRQKADAWREGEMNQHVVDALHAMIGRVCAERDAAIKRAEKAEEWNERLGRDVEFLKEKLQITENKQCWELANNHKTQLQKLEAERDQARAAQQRAEADAAALRVLREAVADLYDRDEGHGLRADHRITEALDATEHGTAGRALLERLQKAEADVEKYAAILSQFNLPCK